MHTYENVRICISVLTLTILLIVSLGCAGTIGRIVEATVPPEIATPPTETAPTTAKSKTTQPSPPAPPAKTSTTARSATFRVRVPPAGYLYHAVYPGGVGAEEDAITPDDPRSYEQLAGKSVVWVYFSHDWFRSRSFPLQTATWIRQAGSLPYIRLMLRSSEQQNQAEPTFTLTRIVNGDLDTDLPAWARAARDFGSPLIAEYGTEVNGEWFSWNGTWNGGGTLDGYGDPPCPMDRNAFEMLIGELSGFAVKRARRTSPGSFM